MPADGCRVTGNKVGDSLGPGENPGLSVPKLEDFWTVELAVAELYTLEGALRGAGTEAN